MLESGEAAQIEKKGYISQKHSCHPQQKHYTVISVFTAQYLGMHSSGPVTTQLLPVQPRATGAWLCRLTWEDSKKRLNEIPGYKYIMGLNKLCGFVSQWPLSLQFQYEAIICSPEVVPWETTATTVSKLPFQYPRY